MFLSQPHLCICLHPVAPGSCQIMTQSDWLARKQLIASVLNLTVCLPARSDEPGAARPAVSSRSPGDAVRGWFSRKAHHHRLLFHRKWYGGIVRRGGDLLVRGERVAAPSEAVAWMHTRPAGVLPAGTGRHRPGLRL